MHPQAVQAVIIHGLHVSDVPKDTPSASAPPVSLPINQTVNLQLLVHSPVQHGHVCMSTASHARSSAISIAYSCWFWLALAHT